MITVEKCESALKNIVLDVVSSKINTSTNPLLTKAKTKSIDGKEIRASIRFGGTDNVASSPETANLPTSDGPSFAEIVVPVKNLYGSFTITDKAIRTNSNCSAEEFAGLLNTEMEGLISASKNNLNKMIYGNGMTPLDSITVPSTTAFVNTFQLPVKDGTGVYTSGETVELFDAGNRYAMDRLVTAITATSFSSSGSPMTLQIGDRRYIYKKNAADNKRGINVNGVDSIFDSRQMYNLDVTNSALAPILPFLHANTSVADQKLTEGKLLDILTAYEEKCGQSADMFLTSTSLRNMLLSDLRNNRVNADFDKLEGGFMALNFSGIPVFADVNCLRNNLYFINSESFNMFEVCDWSWVESDDGSILRQVPGKAAFTATLVKYCDFICTKPFLNGKTYGWGVEN